MAEARHFASLTSHLDAPGESVQRRMSQGLDWMAWHQATYCKPTRLLVSRAMRIASVEPLMDGVPVHDAACGIASSTTVYTPNCMETILRRNARVCIDWVVGGFFVVQNVRRRMTAGPRQHWGRSSNRTPKVASKQIVRKIASASSRSNIVRRW